MHEIRTHTHTQNLEQLLIIDSNENVTEWQMKKNERFPNQLNIYTMSSPIIIVLYRIQQKMREKWNFIEIARVALAMRSLSCANPMFTRSVFNMSAFERRKKNFSLNNNNKMENSKEKMILAYIYIYKCTSEKVSFGYSQVDVLLFTSMPNFNNLILLCIRFCRCILLSAALNLFFRRFLFLFHIVACVMLSILSA